MIFAYPEALFVGKCEGGVYADAEIAVKRNISAVLGFRNCSCREVKGFFLIADPYVLARGGYAARMTVVNIAVFAAQVQRFPQLAVVPDHINAGGGAVGISAEEPRVELVAVADALRHKVVRKPGDAGDLFRAAHKAVIEYSGRRAYEYVDKHCGGDYYRSLDRARGGSGELLHVSSSMISGM